MARHPLPLLYMTLGAAQNTLAWLIKTSDIRNKA